MNQQGRSIVEILGILAIIGVLSVGAIAGYSKAMLKSKINKTIDILNNISSHIRTSYVNQGNYLGLNNGQAIKNNCIPNNLYKANADSNYTSAYEILNPFGGKITIEPTQANRHDTAKNLAFGIKIEGLPKEVCMALTTHDWGGDGKSGVLALISGHPYVGFPSLINYSSTDDYSRIVESNGTKYLIAIPGGKYSVPVNVEMASIVCDQSNFTSYTMLLKYQ